MNNFNDLKKIIVSEDDNIRVEISDDSSLSDDDSLSHDITIRSKTYSDIIESYRDYLKESLTLKNKFKSQIAWLVTIVLYVIVGVTIILSIIGMFYYNKSVIVGLLSSVISFITAFIALPKIITSYAFNKEEEENISKMVEILLPHDVTMKNFIKNKSDDENV